MTVYYYVEAYFKNDERPRLLGNKGSLYVTTNPERAHEHLKNVGGATYKIVEAHEHFRKHYNHLYPFLKAGMTQKEHYELIENDMRKGITVMI